MRIRWTALVGCASLALLSIGAPPAAANPPSAADAKIVKAAEAGVKLLIKAAAKAIGLEAKEAAAKIGALSRAAKTGVNVATLSGVPSTDGVKVSPEQLAGLCDAGIRVEAEFCEARYETCVDAYEGFASNVAINLLGDSEATKRLPGTGGPCDTFVSGLSDVCDSGEATFDRACRALQTAELAQGYAFTRVAAPSLPFVVPTFHVSPPAPFDVSVINSTWADSPGRFRAIVLYPGVTPVGDFTDAATLVVMSNQVGTLAMDDEITFPHVEVERHDEPQEPVASEVFRVFVVEGSTVDSPVALTVPLTIVGPGPCDRPPGKSVITATPTALHLGPVVKNSEAQSKSITLRNSGTAYLQVHATIGGPDVSEFFLFNADAYVQGGGEGSIEVGGSAQTARTYHAVVHLTWDGGLSDVPIDLTVTN